MIIPEPRHVSAPQTWVRNSVSIVDDSYIRKAAIKHKVSYITTNAAAIAAARGIAAYRQGRGLVKSLQEYHADIG